MTRYSSFGAPENHCKWTTIRHSHAPPNDSTNNFLDSNAVRIALEAKWYLYAGPSKFVILKYSKFAREVLSYVFLTSKKLKPVV